MDTSGAFTFDRILKTLLPGLVLLLLLLPYVSWAESRLGFDLNLASFSRESELLSVFVGSGFAFLFGLLLNSMVFALVFPLLWDRYCFTPQIAGLLRIREALIDHGFRRPLREYPAIAHDDVHAFRRAESLV